MKNKDLKKRILEISHAHKLSHIGSCLTSVDIIDDIYRVKKENDPFILSSGHAGLAQYCVLEKYYGFDAEKLFAQHGVHPNTDPEHKIWCSTGSLGHGIGIAVGMALADRTRQVYVLMSDGECAEGSVYESLNVCRKEKLDNIHIYVNANGYGAYREIEYADLYRRLYPYQDIPVKIIKTKSDVFPFLQGLDAHYYTMTDEDYLFALSILR